MHLVLSGTAPDGIDFFDMYTYDMNWNSTMTRAGLSPNNIHLLPAMIELAVQELRGLRARGNNYFDRRRPNVEALWKKFQENTL